MEVTVKVGQHSWRLQTCYCLVSFAVYGDDDEEFPDAPLFALRADLYGSKPGTAYPNYIYPIQWMYFQRSLPPSGAAVPAS
jgi:hypothetical protein